MANPAPPELPPLREEKITWKNIFNSHGDHGPRKEEYDDDDDDEEEEEEEEVEDKEKEKEKEWSGIFPGEAVAGLRAELAALARENRRLKAAAGAGRPSALEGVGRASDLAANKIVELSKRVRELTAELGAAKRRLAAEGPSSAAPSPPPPPPLPPPPSALEAELRECREKLQTSQCRLAESRNQLLRLRHELKIAHKALSSELGEGVSLGVALGTGWRGRAQQILALQARVAELSERAGGGAGDRAPGTATRAAEKLAEAEKAAEAARAEAETERRRAEAAKARARVLTSELASLKPRLLSLQEKSSHDDQLLSSLSSQLNGVLEKARDRETAVADKFEAQLASLRQELAQERGRAQDLQAILAERDARISRLEERIDAAQQHNFPEEERRPFSRASSFEPPSSSHSQEAGSPAAEAERMRLVELLGVTNRRLDDERHALDKAQEQLRVERHKCARLETKLARVELERVGAGGKGGGGGGGYARNKCRPPSRNAELQTLRDRAELLEEKVLALEGRLTTLRQEKEEDHRRYLAMMEESRHAYLQQLRK